MHSSGRSRWPQVDLRSSHPERYLLQYRNLIIQYYWKCYLLRRLYSVCRDVKTMGPCGQYSIPNQPESALLAFSTYCKRSMPENEYPHIMHIFSSKFLPQK
jgi:hypothetical protein